MMTRQDSILPLGIDRLMRYNHGRGPRNDRSDPSRHELAGMSARSGGPPRGTASVSTLPRFFRGVHPPRSDRDPSSPILSPTSGALAGRSGLDREHPSRGGKFNPSRSSPTRERP